MSYQAAQQDTKDMFPLTVVDYTFLTLTNTQDFKKH